MSTGIQLASLPNGVLFNSTTVEARGQLVDALSPAVGVSVYVFAHQAGYVPTLDGTSTSVTVYEDEALTTPLARPLTIDSNGVIPGYIASGQIVDLLCTGGPYVTPQAFTVNVSAVTFGGDASGTSGALVVGTVKGGKTPLTADQNLADIANAGTARTNLGLGTASTHAATDFDAAGTAASAVATETTRAQTAEGTNATAIAAETTRAEAAEAGLIPASQKGAASGVATLDSGQHLTASQVPQAVVSASSSGGPVVWTANTLFKANVLISNAGTTYIVDTQYTSGSTFGATDLANISPLGGGGGPAAVVAGGNLGATPSLNMAAQTNTTNVLYTGTLTANATLTVSGLTSGASLILALTQDGTGGRSFSITVGGSTAGVTVNSTTGSYTVILCYYDGTDLYVKGA